jgi:hypothetical protein
VSGAGNPTPASRANSASTSRNRRSRSGLAAPDAGGVRERGPAQAPLAAQDGDPLAEVLEGHGSGGSTKAERREALTELEIGILVGLLIGEGHFGGDGRQPQITLRMHTDHEALFLWLMRTLPGAKYGPYHHGGRHYFQWMVRGAYLRDTLIPLLDQHLDPSLDAKSFLRYQEMKRRYGLS